jgi:hypothetical protein
MWRVISVFTFLSRFIRKWGEHICEGIPADVGDLTETKLAEPQDLA